MTEQKPDKILVEGWPNLVNVANLTLNHLNEICDPHRSYMAYVGASLGYEIPAFIRNRWSWVEAASYGLLGRIAIKSVTGNTAGQEVEAGQRKLTLASFYGTDGFSRRSYSSVWSEDTTLYIWEQARVMFTLMAWYIESEDENLLQYIKGMLQALMSITKKEGNFILFAPPYDRQEVFGDVAPITLVEPLMKYFEASDDTNALEFCRGIINWAVHPSTNLVDKHYRLSGWLRGNASALAGIARFAYSTNDAGLLNYVENVFRNSLSLTTRYGGTPDTEPCCTNMELTTTALVLTKSGRGEWWDMIDRHFRNHTLACQFTDPKAVKIGHREGSPGPHDDSRDILSRSVGGFSWATAREHLFDFGQLMVCCGGNAMWTLGKIAANSATLHGSVLSINLHFTLDTPLATITNYEPFKGELKVVPRYKGDVRIRKPAYAANILVNVNGNAVTPKDNGTYLYLSNMLAGSTIILRYDMPEKISEETTKLTPGKHCFDVKSEPVVKERIQTRWIGNTVVSIDYESDSPVPLHRLYQNRPEVFKQGLTKTTEGFVPEKYFEW